MKKLVVLLAVVALTAPVFAGDLILDPVDNEDGTLTINYTYTGDAPVGLALIVDSTGDGETQSAAGGPFLNVFIDCYNSNPGNLNDNDFSDDGCDPAADPAGPGVATLPAAVVSLSMGELDENNDAPSPGTLATVDFGGAASGVITGDTLRGCVVDVLGAEMTINGVACDTASVPFSVTDTGGGCACRGDVALSNGAPPGDGVTVDLGDFNYFLGQLGAVGAPFVIDPTPANLLCADVAASNGAPVIGGDGKVDLGDFNYFLGQLGAVGAPFSTTCLP